MSSIIKNITAEKIIIPKIDLKGFQAAEIYLDKISYITANYRVFSVEIDIEIFIDCLLGKQIETPISYIRTDIQCLFCIGGLSDWVQNAMKKPIIYPKQNKDSLDYDFGFEQVLLYRIDKDIKLILAQPIKDRTKGICKHCNGTGLYVMSDHDRDKLRNTKLQKDLILKELENL
jgi:hypothetical protein